MPTAEEHIIKYRHNHDFYSFGIASGKRDFSDWKVIVLFYAAVHLVEAVLYAELQADPSDHNTREQLMVQNGGIFSSDSQRRYRTLRSLSHKARYTAADISGAEVGLAQDCLEYLEEEYKKYIA